MKTTIDILAYTNDNPTPNGWLIVALALLVLVVLWAGYKKSRP